MAKHGRTYRCPKCGNPLSARLLWDLTDYPERRLLGADVRCGTCTYSKRMTAVQNPMGA